jgi:hypothetical protein
MHYAYVDGKRVSNHLVMGMVTTCATGRSKGEGWGKEIAAICGSGLQDTGFYPGLAPFRVKTCVLLV